MMKMMHHYLSIISFFLLTACGPQIPLSDYPNKSEQQPHINKSETNIEDVIHGKKILVVSNNHHLFLVDPEYPSPVFFYTLEEKDQPSRYGIETFKISPDHRWVIWYSPTRGLLALEIVTKTLHALYPPSDFLNTNPFFDFHSQRQSVIFISDEGKQLQEIQLPSLAQKAITIPYPYGNLFQLSPDGETILYISGYGQAKEKPQFMFATIQGEHIKQFTTETDLANRSWITWDAESQGVYMMENNKIIYYSLSNPERPIVAFTLPNNSQATAIYRLNSTIFVASDQGFWHVYDLNDKKEIARTPTIIAQELIKPHFIPWSSSQFLIEETIIDKSIQWNRLWISDFQGNKKMVVPEYQRFTLEIETPEL